MTDQRFDVRSKYLREHLSRRGAAERIGVPEAALRRYEKGLGLHPENAGKIADYLGVDITDLPQFAAPERAS